MEVVAEAEGRQYSSSALEDPWEVDHQYRSWLASVGPWEALAVPSEDPSEVVAVHTLAVVDHSLAVVLAVHLSYVDDLDWKVAILD